jgi:hypothetical protein
MKAIFSPKNREQSAHILKTTGPFLNVIYPLTQKIKPPAKPPKAFKGVFKTSKTRDRRWVLESRPEVTER